MVVNTKSAPYEVLMQRSVHIVERKHRYMSFLTHSDNFSRHSNRLEGLPLYIGRSGTWDLYPTRELVGTIRFVRRVNPRSVQVLVEKEIV